MVSKTIQPENAIRRIHKISDPDKKKKEAKAETTIVAPESEGSNV